MSHYFEVQPPKDILDSAKKQKLCMVMSISEGDKTMMMVGDAWLSYVKNNDKACILYTFLIGKQCNPVYYKYCRALIKAERKTKVSCGSYNSNTVNLEEKAYLIQIALHFFFIKISLILTSYQT